MFYKNLVRFLLILSFVAMAGCASPPPEIPTEAPVATTVPETSVPVESPGTPSVGNTQLPDQITPEAGGGTGGVAIEIAHANVEREASPSAAPDQIQTLVAGNSAFAFDLYQRLSAQDGNLFFSPYSISLALAMTSAGARGETEAQMRETLHFTLPQEEFHPAFNALDQELASRPEAPADKQQPFQLKIANSIWGQKGYEFLPAFLDTLARNYGAGLRLVDFQNAAEATRVTINDWVSEQTEGKIQNLIPQGVITPLTRLVLANAIYFKADWLVQFNKEKTSEAPFNLLEGTTVNVPMMSFSSPELLPYARGQGFQAVELPYVGETTSMLVIVPDKGTFADYEKSFNAEKLNEITSSLKRESLALHMPKFKFETQYGLVETLASMGMKLAFTDGEADFSGMDGTRSFFIGDILHKAYVAVDEEGTEAAAATAVVVGITSVQESIPVNIDRPFLFVIRDNPTGSVLFIGRVLNPLQ